MSFHVIVLIFFFRDIAKEKLHIFDSTGNQISQIDGFNNSGVYIGNKALIKGNIIKPNDRTTALYNYNGQLIAKGNVIDENREVTILITQKGEQKYFFKDQEIQIPENAQEITPFLEYVKIKLKNGNVGLLSNSLERTIIPPKYKVLGHSKNYTSHAYPYCGEPEIDRFIYALDSEKKLTIFNSNGEEIKLQVDIYFSKLRIINPIRIMKLKDNLSFYVIHNRPDNIFYIFDEKWNFIGTDKKKSTDYYFLAAENDSWFLVPIRVLNYFREKIDEDDFFMVKGSNQGRNNIIDSNLQFVYKDDIGIVRKINNNHFILNYVNRQYKIDDRVLIKLSKQ